MEADTYPGPLSGLIVIDMAAMLAAPLGAMLLADFGATVIKIEPPGGEHSRTNGWKVNGTSLWWRQLGRNKLSVTLNLKAARGRELMLKLIEGADLLVENMRPGKLENLGLAPETLWQHNPKLVILRLTGWGQTGPKSDHTAFGTQVEAFTGFAHGNGYPEGPPTLPTFPLADMVAGYMSAFAAMVALWEREQNPGKCGQVIDLSLFEAMLGFLGPQASIYDKLGVVPGRLGNRSPTAVPRNIYRTADDRWISISCSTNPLAIRAFKAIGRPELAADPRFATLDARQQNVDAIDDIFAEWFARHTLDEGMQAFTGIGAAAAPVNTIADIVKDAHVKAREAIISVDAGDLGPLKMQGVFPRLSRTPGKVRWAGRSLGHDTKTVLGGWLGLSDEEIRSLREDGVIGEGRNSVTAQDEKGG